MKFILPVIIFIFLISCSHRQPVHIVNTFSLLDELANLNRLASLPDADYTEVQFSSYDRRSRQPSDSNWFSNDDGFGSEPIPAFQEVLKKPDASGNGEYLICDIKQPGAIVRLWTADINGNIRLFLDDTETPVFEGKASDFFWKTAESLSGEDSTPEYADFLRQYDATYFPIPFNSRCRIEWIGDISKIHFYHIGLRLYAKGTRVETFEPDKLGEYADKLEETRKIFSDPSITDAGSSRLIGIPQMEVPDSGSKEIFRTSGNGAVVMFALKIKAEDIESALRKSILSICFDDSSVPQVEAPAGDFFGAAPGLNPYQSLPFTVQPDGKMICRFIMPFRRNVSFRLENYSGKKILTEGEVRISDFDWKDGKTMHFRARWRIDHNLTAAPFKDIRYPVQDINYLMASGTGRVVGAAALVYNPSRATTSWGNWWGEGDEKIYIDRDTFPSFFGTGTEDYFNYSWSATRIFFYPYCGQPRNDGPGNRGYVSNYRWHIADDILFHDKIAFSIELGHHGIVPGFSYGRIVYYYALPGTIDDYKKISVPELRNLTYSKWDPISYLGSADYTYFQAEKLVPVSTTVKAEKGRIWADSLIVMWKPAKKGEKLKFRIPLTQEIGTSTMGLTLAHSPDGGNILVSMNGQYLKFDGNEFINLYEPSQTTLVNHFSDAVALKKGLNEVVIESIDSNPGKKIGLDFIWVKGIHK
jgi:hypothetical protein